MEREHVEKFLKDYMNEELKNGKWTEENKFEKAVCWGYRDASRTFAGIEKTSDESFWTELSKAIKIKDFFTEKNVRNQQEFDEKHKEMCDALRKCFVDEDVYKGVTYGQAQKIINMTFKYLYACL